MLTVRPKISELTFRAFGRGLHPELFEVFASRQVSRNQYVIRADITSAGHVLTWKRHGRQFSEVAASSHQPLPQGGRLLCEPIQHPNAWSIDVDEVLQYRCQFQLDPADPVTFAMIQEELLKSVPCEGLVFRFQSSGRLSFGAISYVNIQSRQNSVHVRAFHTFPDAYLVMKSESVFSVMP